MLMPDSSQIPYIIEREKNKTKIMKTTTTITAATAQFTIWFER